MFSNLLLFTGDGVREQTRGAPQIDQLVLTKWLSYSSSRWASAYETNHNTLLLWEISKITKLLLFSQPASFTAFYVNHENKHGYKFEYK